MQSKLLDFLIKEGNASGAIRSAPRGLKELKSFIEDIPVEIHVPSVDAIFDTGRLVSGLVDQIRELGSLAALGGDFQGIIQKIQAELGDEITDIMRIEKGRLEAAIRAALPIGELERAIGGVTSIVSGFRGKS